MMSSCPAYLGLTIFDVDSAAGDAATEEMEEGRRSTVLLRTDLLIFCPSNFTVNVRLGPLPSPAAASSTDAESMSSIVVRFADSGRLPSYVRLTHVRSDTGDPVDQDMHTGARRRPSPAPKTSHIADGVTDFSNGNILIAIAITGALFIVVYVGQNSARATTHVAGTFLSVYYI